MSLLFKRLRVHQVFGANTDVGKTILTSALVRASAQSSNVFYLKPVSTGSPDTADVEHIARYAGPHRDRVHAECLYQYQEPVSPHLAARIPTNGDDRLIPSDATVSNSIAHHIRQCASQSNASADMYVETAGGVHSPTISGSTQVDAYRPLFLPTVLVGDSKLGGISSTISAYESLLLRGYIIDSILLFSDDYYRNWEYLASYFEERSVRVSAVPPPPAILPDHKENQESTENYYQGLIDAGEISSTVDHLNSCHKLRLEELESMPQRTLETIWWPFVQHSHYQKPLDVNVIDSAYGDFFTVYRPSEQKQSSILQPQLDGSASWWTQAVGHAHPSLTLAAARASGRYGHVMFPRASHLPALRLAERLVDEGPGKEWATRAFISDNGSTGMEVALKMALRAYSLRHGSNFNSASKKDIGILGLKGSYHGDTIGAMNACEEGVYTCEWHQAKGYWLDAPTVGIKQGKVVISIPPSIDTNGVTADQLESDNLSEVYDIPTRLNEFSKAGNFLAMVYRRHIEKTLTDLRAKGVKLGALVLEPLVLGAGGMRFIDPLFQRVLIDVVRELEDEATRMISWSGMPVIFDEVFVGLYRIGVESTTSILRAFPDISVNAKILTGGLVPLAVTLTNEAIYDAFLSDNKADALLHGHSYTAYAVGCEVANETLNILGRLRASGAWRAAEKPWAGIEGKPGLVWSFWDPHFVNTVSHMASVEEVMTLGTLLAIKLKDDDAGYVSQSAEAVFQSIAHATADSAEFSAPGGAPFGVHYRTLGNVAYFMTSLNTSPLVIRSLEDKIWQTLNSIGSAQ